MPGLLPNPRVMPRPVQQFPLPGSQGERDLLMLRRLFQQQQGFRPAPGLLDRMPAQQAGPARPGLDQYLPQGLLQQVVWDRLRAKGGLGLPDVTEGAPAMRGGGRAQGELPLQGGMARIEPKWRFNPVNPPRNTPVQMAQDFQGRLGVVPSRPGPPRLPEPGEPGTYSTVTPSGAQVIVKQSKQGAADVTFWSTKFGEKPSMSNSLRRFTEVAERLKDFVAKHNPKQIDFMAMGEQGSSHQKLYDRAAPELAKALGGTLEITYPGHYRIHIETKK